MAQAQINLTIPDKALKDRVSKKLKERGATMKFFIISALEAYDRDKYDLILKHKQK